MLQILLNRAKRKTKAFLQSRNIPLFQPLPKIVFFVVTTRCNMRCVMCDVGINNRESQFYKNLTGGGKNLDLDLSRSKPFIDELGDYKPTVILCATEPLLYGNLHELIREFVKRNIRVEMLTNGYLLKEHAEGLMEDGLSAIHISLDGIGAVHDNIRGIPGCYEKIMEGLRFLLEKREKSSHSIEIKISYTITHLNYDHITTFYNTMRSLGLDWFTFFFPDFITKQMAIDHNELYGSYDNGGFRSTESNLTEEHIKQVDLDTLYKEVQNTYDQPGVHYLPNIYSKKELEIYFTKHNQFIGRDYCRAPWETLMVTPSGDVLPESRCFHIKMGNIYEQTLKEIWYGEKYKKLRAFFHKHKSFPVCTRCCAIFDFNKL